MARGHTVDQDVHYRIRPMNSKSTNPSGPARSTLATPAHQNLDLPFQGVDDPASGHKSSHRGLDIAALTAVLVRELSAELQAQSSGIQALAERIAIEVDRICEKSDRIQTSGQIRSWQLALARYRLEKCLSYYKLGSRQGRVDLHSSLSAMIYRQIAPAHSQLGFQGRYTLIEDFMQGFYAESLKVFRRENQMADTYQPRTRLELAEYMAFTEQYAKRRITLPTGQNQQLIILRAQRFANRQPHEIAIDMEMATESARSEDAEAYGRSAAVQMVREQMVSEQTDPSDSVLRDRIVQELVQYLESQGQSDCIDYLVLKLQDLSVPEIDEVLGLSARQRDYLQQRFKYHVEKFALSHNWQLVHQWLGADLDQNLGLSPQEWQAFWVKLSPEQQQLFELKQAKTSDQEAARILKCTPKQFQKRWYKVLELAWQTRNQNQ